jgi:hypothetical protein
VLTGLPIIFPETLTLDARASPARAKLETRYRLVPVSVADRGTLDGHRLLLMAQPQAQPAEVLVDLDRWVRGGGHVLLLADPALEWPSERPLGDVLRPPIAFADTGLLIHWGARLDAPDDLGGKSIRVGNRQVTTRASGRLVALNHACTVEADGFIAVCRVGQGKATIVADADFVDSERPANLEFLLAELAKLEQ